MRDPTGLLCKELVELVTEYLGGTLSTEDRVRLEQHLLVCPPCTVHVGQIKRTIELAGELHDDPAGAAPEAALVEVFRRWKQR